MTGVLGHGADSIVLRCRCMTALQLCVPAPTLDDFAGAWRQLAPEAGFQLL